MGLTVGFEKTAFLGPMMAAAGRGIAGMATRAATGVAAKAATNPGLMKSVGQAALRTGAAGAIGGAAQGALQKDEQGNRGGLSGALKGGLTGGLAGAAAGGAYKYLRAPGAATAGAVNMPGMGGSAKPALPAASAAPMRDVTSRPSQMAQRPKQLLLNGNTGG